MSVEGRLERAVARSPLERVVSPQRAVRFVEWGLVGAVGMVIDLAVTLTLLQSTHYAVANVAGFLLAVSFNFVGNRRLTYDRPKGSLSRQYASYVLLHGATFGLRLATIASLVELAGAPGDVATVVGVGVAAVSNFVGTEAIFGGVGAVWFDVVEAANHVAHVVYSSRIRKLLLWAGLYDLLFAAYTRLLAVAHPHDRHEIVVGDARATVRTERPTETVSVMHTLEKERAILTSFVDDVQPDDTVLDVGANVGIFALLAADATDDVWAVEAHPPTAERLRANAADTSIRTQSIALGPAVGRVSLAVHRDVAGTQRPTVASDGTHEVQMVPGDALPAPDVLKIDVEGFEHEVLDGFERTFKRSPPRVVYLEAHSDADGASLRGRLEQWGYAVACLQQGEQTYLRGEFDADA